MITTRELMAACPNLVLVHVTEDPPRQRSGQGLMPAECSRFDVVDAYAAFADWWNRGGLTARCHAKGRSIDLQLSRMRYYNPGAYLESEASKDIYVELVRRYHPDRVEEAEADMEKLRSEA